MKIPDYPSFEPLRLEHKDIINELFLRFPPEISEFTFTNLYSWRESYGLEVSLVDGFIIIRAGGRRGVGYFEPIGSGDKLSVIGKVLRAEGGSFIRIPGPTAELFSKDGFIKAGRDPDNDDYLYLTKDLVSLAGKRYDGKRNLIKKFKSNYSYEYVRLGADCARLCLDFEEKWCLVKDCDNVEGLDDERRAIREMAANFSAFGLIGGAITVDRKTCALAIGEKLNPSTMVMHVLKADASMAGLYQTMTSEFLSCEGGGFEYINMEQDLGVEGLRKSKSSYHPCGMVKKYTISLI